jgi:hypothetical protein
MESKTHHNKAEQGDWKSIVQGFVVNMFERIGDNVSQQVHGFISKLKKRTIGAVLMLVGAIFFLVSIALLINSFLGSGLQWVGWSLVGWIIICVGYVVFKE